MKTIKALQIIALNMKIIANSVSKYSNLSDSKGETKSNKGEGLESVGTSNRKRKS